MLCTLYINRCVHCVFYSILQATRGKAFYWTRANVPVCNNASIPLYCGDYLRSGFYARYPVGENWR